MGFNNPYGLVVECVGMAQFLAGEFGINFRKFKVFRFHPHRFFGVFFRILYFFADIFYQAFYLFHILVTCTAMLEMVGAAVPPTSTDRL